MKEFDLNKKICSQTNLMFSDQMIIALGREKIYDDSEGIYSTNLYFSKSFSKIQLAGLSFVRNMMKLNMLGLNYAAGDF